MASFREGELMKRVARVGKERDFYKGKYEALRQRSLLLDQQVKAIKQQQAVHSNEARSTFVQ